MVKINDLSRVPCPDSIWAPVASSNAPRAPCIDGTSIGKHCGNARTTGEACGNVVAMSEGPEQLGTSLGKCHPS